MSTFFDLEQSSYWLLLIWIFTLGISLNRMPKKQELVCDSFQERLFWPIAILMVLPYILWAGYRTSGADTRLYVGIFHETAFSLSDIPDVLTSGRKDPGFTVLMILCKAIGISDHQTFFLLVAALQMLCLVYTFRRYAEDFWLCIFLFVASTDYISWMHNGIRQFIAVSITFACFHLLIRKKYLRYTLLVLLASEIHGSAIIMLPLALIMQGSALNWKTLLAVAVVVLCIPFIDQVTPLLESMMKDTQYGDVMTNEIWVNDDGTNFIRVVVYSVPALLVFLSWRHSIHSEDPAVNMCINASVLTMVLYLASMVTSGIYVGRLPIYTSLYSYMILPRLIDRMFEEKSAKLVKMMMIGLYSGFFFYQLRTWGSI